MMRKEGYQIGEVSRLTGIPKDTLLYYDKIGLFKPDYVNPDTGYRYYSYNQFWQIDIIQCCRNLDIPIATIRDILESKDNEKIVGLMQEHQEEARRKSEYYKRVAEDIDWYSRQYDMVRDARPMTEIVVEHLPQRKVIYAENAKNVRDYHSRLLAAAQSALRKPESFRRRSGFFMDPKGIKLDNFMKLAEYAEFEADVEEEIDENNYRILPEGDYACCVVNVVHRQVDFKNLDRWLTEHQVEPDLVLVEEIGFQLFDYFGQGYPCRVMVKLPVDSGVTP